MWLAPLRLHSLLKLEPAVTEIRHWCDLVVKHVFIRRIEMDLAFVVRVDIFSNYEKLPKIAELAEGEECISDGAVSLVTLHAVQESRIGCHLSNPLQTGIAHRPKRSLLSIQRPLVIRSICTRIGQLVLEVEDIPLKIEWYVSEV